MRTTTGTIRPPAVAIAFVILFAFAGPTHPVADTDTWWHLRTGELILNTSSIPRADPFSWTAVKRPWVAHEWGAEVVFVTLQRAVGPVGLWLLAGLLVGASFLLLHALLRRTGAEIWGRAVALVLALFLSSLIWSIRPHLFSFFFVCLFLERLAAERASPSRATWILVPATALWANLHGAFVLGPLLIACFLVGAAIERSQTRRLLVIGALCVVAGSLNPHGPALYLHPLEVVEISARIQEWRPPSLREIHGLVFTLMVVATLAGLVVRRRRPESSRFIAALAGTLLGFAALKNVAYAGALLAPLTALAAGGLLPESRATRRPERIVLTIVVVIAAMAAAFVVIRNLSGKSDRELLSEQRFPSAAVEQLERLEPGRLANPYDWGGYLIYRARSFPVSIDGRNDMYGTELFERQLLLEELRPGWEDFLSDNDVEYVLWQRRRPLAEAMRLLPGWELVHEDRRAVLFVRDY